MEDDKHKSNLKCIYKKLRNILYSLKIYLK